MSSPRIRAALESQIIDLIDEVFAYVHDILETGDTASRTAVVKQIMPMLLKVSRESDAADTEDVEQMVAETRRLVEAMGATLPGQLATASPTADDADAELPDDAA